jgi:hypothetical protein
VKKFLGLIFVVATMIFVAPSAQAKTSSDNDNIRISTNFAPQRQYRRYEQRNRYNRRARTFFQTRYVRSGYRLYRNTYRVTYLPNGRIRTRLVSRARVR